MPPNAEAWRVTFAYTPAVALTFSDELVSGDSTGLVNLTVTANFATDVTGVAKSDFTVTGAIPGEFRPLSASKYSLDLVVFNATEAIVHEVWVKFYAATGNIYPPNFKAPDVYIDYGA